MGKNLLIIVLGPQNFHFESRHTVRHLKMTSGHGTEYHEANSALCSAILAHFLTRKQFNMAAVSSFPTKKVIILKSNALIDHVDK